jgi:TetR/AcrR family transcriptional regulator, transcriptional repressor for nem operon
MAPDWTATSLALHTGRHPGAFILAKATGGAEIEAASIHHLRRFIECCSVSEPSRQDI